MKEDYDVTISGNEISVEPLALGSRQPHDSQVQAKSSVAISTISLSGCNLYNWLFDQYHPVGYF